MSTIPTAILIGVERRGLSDELGDAAEFVAVAVDDIGDGNAGPEILECPQNAGVLLFSRHDCVLSSIAAVISQKTLQPSPEVVIFPLFWLQHDWSTSVWLPNVSTAQ